jgi:ABC-type spermidine/putrescine transport system permease subunit I
VQAARRQRVLTFALGAPALLFLAALLIYPLARFVAVGLAEGGFALYASVVGDVVYIRVFLGTFAIGLVATVLSLLIAYPLAYFLATTRPGWAVVGFFLVLLPFWTSIVVRTYAWMILLGRNGLINRVLLALGASDEPLPLMFNHLGNMIGMVHWLLPFAVFPIYGAMLRLDRRLLLAAAGLGAGPLQRFWSVYLPLTLPGVFAGAGLVFVLAIAAFVTPALLGGGRVIMMAQVIEQQVRQFLDWPVAAALAVVLSGAALLFYSGLGLLLRGSRHVA